MNIKHRGEIIRSCGVYLILVVRGGDIREKGEHGELFQKKGFIKDLYNNQFEMVGLQ